MKKKKRHRKKRYHAKVKYGFPILYPSRMGTPFSFPAGSGNNSGEPMAGAESAPASSPAPASESSNRSRSNVLKRLRESLGLVEYMNDAPQVAWGGYSAPSFAAVGMRQGGPVIGGPGFYYDGGGVGGRYDFQRSPGLGFRTEMAWRVWEKIMQVIDTYPNLPRQMILMRAMAKAGVHHGQMDPSEFRLLEMGIDWYLSSNGSLAANRSVYY